MSEIGHDSHQISGVQPELVPEAETKYFKIGLWLTIGVLASATAYVFVVWPLIIAMKPNEFGDFLAGIFGPLALLWVVLGFLQQGVELRNSRAALLLQAQELKESVAAQRDMGRAAWEQVNLDRDGILAARAKELEPSLMLRGGGGGTGRGTRYFEFFLSNHGAIAHKIEIAASIEFQSLSPSYLAQLRADNEQQVRLEFPDGQQMNDFVFTVVARDRESESHVWEYRIQGADYRLSVENMFGSKLSRP